MHRVARLAEILRGVCGAEVLLGLPHSDVDPPVWRSLAQRAVQAQGDETRTLHEVPAGLVPRGRSTTRGRGLPDTFPRFRCVQASRISRHGLGRGRGPGRRRRGVPAANLPYPQQASAGRPGAGRPSAPARPRCLQRGWRSFSPGPGAGPPDAVLPRRGHRSPAGGPFPAPAPG